MRTAASDRHYRFKELDAQWQQMAERNNSCIHYLQLLTTTVLGDFMVYCFILHVATIHSCMAAHINYCSLSESEIGNHLIRQGSAIEWAVSNEYSQYRFVHSQHCTAATVAGHRVH